jgi:hypothetical protein
MYASKNGNKVIVNYLLDKYANNIDDFDNVNIHEHIHDDYNNIL